MKADKSRSDKKRAELDGIIKPEKYDPRPRITHQQLMALRLKDYVTIIKPVISCGTHRPYAMPIPLISKTSQRLVFAGEEHTFQYDIGNEEFIGVSEPVFLFTNEDEINNRRVLDCQVIDTLLRDLSLRDYYSLKDADFSDFFNHVHRAKSALSGECTWQPGSTGPK